MPRLPVASAAALVAALALLAPACDGDDAGAGPADAAGAEDAAPDALPGPDGAEDPGDAAPDDAAAPPDAGPDDTSAPADAFAPPDLSPLGGDRPAEVYVPKAWRPDVAWPVVVMLHGYSANALVQDVIFNLRARVDEGGYVLVTPDGTVDSKGNRFWNATPYCCNFDGSDVDDVGYLLGLLDEAAARYHTDPQRTVIVGHSNGAFMANRLACDAADRVSGIVTLAGTTFKAAAACTPSRPVSVLHVHGTDDDSISYEPTLYLPGAEETVLRWVAADGCPGEPALAGPFDFDDGAAGAETTERRWTGCADGTEVALWTMDGSAHIPVVTEAFQEAFLARALAWTRAAP